MIPSFEYIGSAFSGSTISANSFLAFDTLFTSLGSIVGNYTHIHISAMKITEFVKLLVPFILTKPYYLGDFRICNAYF